MSKTTLKGSVMLGPLPAVMVSVGDMAKPNIITIAWTGVICSDPPRVYVSINPRRYSYNIVDTTNEFVINLVSKDMVASCDFCGIRSGQDVDKFAELGLTATKADNVSAPLIEQCPVNLECKVFNKITLGTHTMFMADVVAVHVDDQLITDGKIDFAKAQLINYQHGDYYANGRQLGRFGFSVQRKFIRKHGKGVDVDIDHATLTKRKNPKNKK